MSTRLKQVPAMTALPEWTIRCPYCGEENTLLIDPSLGEQDYVEDCQVCCQPMRVRASLDAGVVVAVEVTQENG
jgi:hypothetical protein